MFPKRHIISLYSCNKAGKYIILVSVACDDKNAVHLCKEREENNYEEDIKMVCFDVGNNYVC